MNKYCEISSRKGIIVNVMKNIFYILCFVFLISQISAGSFDQGKESFLNNKPSEAIGFFEKAISENPGNENVFMYLGLSYIQKGLTEKAISIFLKGAELNGSQKGRFYLNAGNAYYSLDDLENALGVYDLIIEEGYGEKGDALLNRANIFMNREDYPYAVELYKNYLVEDPLSNQKEKILRLISLIESKLEAEALETEKLAAEAERLRLAEEQRKASDAAEAERLRLAEEQRKADEAARQQALMNDILNSLSNIGDDTQNIAADSETIENTDEDSDIDD